MTTTTTTAATTAPASTTTTTTAAATAPVKLRKDPTKRSPPPPKVSSTTLDQQVQAFLREGGKIDYVNPGVSGQQNLPGRKHIVIDSKPKDVEQS
jgi:hypothetical protein